MVDAIRLQHAVDRSEIVNLVSRSIIARDSGFWDKLAECYHSEAEFTSSWWQGKPADFVKVASRKLDEARAEGGEQKHMTSNHWIEIKGDRATAECDLILYMRSVLKGTEVDVTTWSRRLHLLAREEGEWKIWRRFAIYEKDRMEPVDPAVKLESRFDFGELERFPKAIRYHLWRNEQIGMGDGPAKKLCIRGSEQERNIREEARAWLE